MLQTGGSMQSLRSPFGSQSNLDRASRHGYEKRLSIVNGPKIPNSNITLIKLVSFF
jgi:hypothetical protein